MAIMTTAKEAIEGWIGLCVLLLLGGGMCIFLIGNLIYDFYQREVKPRRIAKEKRKEKCKQCKWYNEYGDECGINNTDPNCQKWKVNLDNPKDWEVK